MGEPCVMCASTEQIYIVLIDGRWHAWPVVATYPNNRPVVRCPCPECSRDEFEAWRQSFNARLADATT